MDKVERNAIYQYWMESEREWGQRPDGFSLHLTNSDLENFIKEYWNSMPDRVLDEYSYPDNIFSTAKIVSVPEAAYQMLIEAKKAGQLGIRSYQIFETWLANLKTR